MVEERLKFRGWAELGFAHSERVRPLRYPVPLEVRRNGHYPKMSWESHSALSLLMAPIEHY
jgi:hypothetical protein